MKFQCRERRERAYAKAKAKKLALEKWHPFFMIWPRELQDGTCRCFEWVERRKKWIDSYYAGWYTVWIYREKP